MDPNWHKTELPKDCYQCILCHAVIPVKNKKKDRFEKHLKTDHGIFYNRNLILVICFLGRIQFFKLIDSIKNEKQTRDAMVQTENITLHAGTQTDTIEIEDTAADSAGDQVTTETLMEQIDKLTHVLQLNGRQDAKTLEELVTRDQSSESPEMQQEISDDDSNSEEAYDSESVSEIEQEENFNKSDEADIITTHESHDIENQKTKRNNQKEESIEDIQNFIRETGSDNDKESLESPFKRVKISPDSSEMIIDFITKESDYFKEKPKEISTSSEARALKFTETDPSLPEGWRARSFVSKRGRGRVDWNYLSPELKVFRSKVGVVEYMRAMGGYSDAEMDRVCPGIRIKKEKV